MTKKFLCVQGSPEIPKGAIALPVEGFANYAVQVNGCIIPGLNLSAEQVEGNSCWEVMKEEPAGKWIPARGTFYYYIDNRNIILSQMWSSDDTDNALLEACNVFRTMEEAGDEVKRRESIANAWWPDKNFDFFLWDFLCKEAVLGGNKDSFTSYAYIGACHKTREACEAWGKEYAHLFNKRPKHD